MPKPNRPQTYENHSKYNPLYHFVASPLLALYLGFTTVQLLRTPSWTQAIHFGFALGVWALSAASRLTVLTVQDRIIRLEMRLRLDRVLPAELATRSDELGLRQLIALRFASDAELPALVQRTLDGELTSSKEIKKAIQRWQPDHLRA
jgi:hypothetical protein